MFSLKHGPIKFHESIIMFQQIQGLTFPLVRSYTQPSILVFVFQLIFVTDSTMVNLYDFPPFGEYILDCSATLSESMYN